MRESGWTPFIKFRGDDTSLTTICPAFVPDGMQDAVSVFPGQSGFLATGGPVPFEDQGHFLFERGHSAPADAQLVQGSMKKVCGDLVGKSVAELGPRVQQWLLEVLRLRSQPTVRRTKTTLFPLPSSSSILSRTSPQLSPLEVTWLGNICLGLNSLWGDGPSFGGEVSEVARECLSVLVKDVKRVVTWSGQVEQFDWDVFFATRTIDYKGDEVKTAREFSWQNIAPALPKEIGRVPLSEVCTLGAKHYVDHFDSYIRPTDGN